VWLSWTCGENKHTY